MTPEEALDQIVATSADYAQAVYKAYLRGVITAEEMAALLTAKFSYANLMAASLAAQGVSAALSGLLGTFVPPVAAALPETDTETRRLTPAVRTLVELMLKERAQAAVRLERFARCEPLDTHRVAFGEALEVSVKNLGAAWTAEDASEGKLPERKRLVIGWRRRLHPGACELCGWLERDGYIYPPERRMFHHKGCRCTQELVASEHGRVWANQKRKTTPLPRETDARRHAVQGQYATLID